MTRSRSRSRYRRSSRCTRCAYGYPVSIGALDAIEYANEYGLMTFIATAETKRYATSKQQQKFLHDIGLGRAARNYLYTIPRDYETNGKEDSLRKIISRARRMGIHKDEIVFFDDLQEHVDKALSLGIRAYKCRTRRVGNKTFPIGISESILRKAKRGLPQAFIFDIDGTLTNEAAFEEEYLDTLSMS